jgi:hypothetical protein
MPSNSNNMVNNINSAGFGMIDLSGFPNNMNSNANSNPNVFMNTPSSFVTPSDPAMTQIFKNNEVIVFSALIKSSDKTNVNGAFYISNNTEKTLNNVKMNLSVKKNVNCKVLSTSGSVLEANKSSLIKKV